MSLKLLDTLLSSMGLVRINAVQPYDAAMTLQGGAAKRLDEHRELVNLFTANAPHLFETHFWLMGWLESQDSYLDALHRIAVDRDLVHLHAQRTLTDRPPYRSARQ